MTSSGSRGAVQQDYIARIRHSNALPIPPFPPKLLDIPNTGLSSGQYTSPAFGTRLLREQALVIDADEFQGMDFNLVGFPGAFEGDDRYLKFPEHPLEAHPKDRALLRPLNALGKATTTPAGVTFLRRSEYTTSGNVLKNSTALRRTKETVDRQARTRQKDVDRENPQTILRHIVKAFNVAYPHDAYRGQDSTVEIRGAEPTAAEREAWDRPLNPLRTDLSLIDSYPVLPDLGAISDLGSYMTIKFNGNPGARDDKYDKRLDVAMLQPSGASAEAQAKYQEKMAEWQANPNNGTKPPELLDDFVLYLPENEDSLRAIKRKFSATDPQADDELLYDANQVATEKKCFKYRRVRKFQASSKTTTMEEPFEDTVAIALHDPETYVGFVPGTKSRLQKAAYIYPIGVSMKIKPARPVTMNTLLANPSMQVPDDEEVIDVLDLFIKPMAAETEQSVAAKREALYQDKRVAG